MAHTILVTGSNSGFGRLTVEALAHQGYNVFAGMRDVAGRNARAAGLPRELRRATTALRPWHDWDASATGPLI